MISRGEFVKLVLLRGQLNSHLCISTAKYEIQFAEFNLFFIHCAAKRKTASFYDLTKCYTRV